MNITNHPIPKTNRELEKQLDSRGLVPQRVVQKLCFTNSSLFHNQKKENIRLTSAIVSIENKNQNHASV